MIFLPSIVSKLISTVKTFQGISNSTISADLHGILAPEESPNWTTQFPCSQFPCRLWTRQAGAEIGTSHSRPINSTMAAEVYPGGHDIF